MHFFKNLTYLLLGQPVLPPSNNPNLDFGNTRGLTNNFLNNSVDISPFYFNYNQTQFDATFYGIADQLFSTNDHTKIQKSYDDVIQHFTTNNYNPESIELLKELLDIRLPGKKQKPRARYLRNLQSANQSLIGLDFTDTQVQQACDMINTLRSKIAKKFGVPNMIKLNIDNDLNSAEKAFVKTLDAVPWLYEYQPTPPPWESKSLNFDILTQNQTFRDIAANFTDLLPRIDAENLVTNHDTSSLKLNRPLSQILSGAFNVLTLRLVEQYNCFVLTKCSALFDGFEACFLKLPSCQRGHGWVYTVTAAYPLSQTTTFVFLPGQGKFAKNPTQLSTIGYAFMWTYGMPKQDQYGVSTWPPLTGSPFTISGQLPCSQCPNSHPYPETSSGLCLNTNTAAKFNLG